MLLYVIKNGAVKRIIPSFSEEVMAFETSSPYKTKRLVCFTVRSLRVRGLPSSWY